MNQFSLGEAFKQGWELTKKHFGFLIGVLVFTFLISLILQLVLSTLTKQENIINVLLFFVVYIVTIVVGGVLTMGTIKIFLALVDKKPTSFADLFSCLNLFWQYLGASILYGLIVLGGMILFIIPGIRWAVKYQFCLNFIVEKGVGPINALKMSGAVTRGYKWQLFFLGILLMLVNFIGLLVIVIGLFVTVPLSIMTYYVAYRMLTQKVPAQDMQRVQTGSPQPAQTPA